MPPLPKHPSARQRRNKSTSKATLHAVGTRPSAPELPDRGLPWHPLTIAFWDDVWSSPMAAEYEQADVHGLYVVAQLTDEFWSNPSTTLAAELRLQRQPYGLTPVDRRRLQWEVVRGDEAQATTAKRRTPTAAARAGEPDPRELLA